MNRQVIIDKLEGLSQKQKWLITIGTLILLVGGYWYLYFLPQQNTLHTLEQEIASLDATIPTLTNKLKRLPALKEQYATLQRELVFARNLLPQSNSDMENLLSEIEALGNEQGIEFLLFAPGSEELHEYYASRSVNLNINGQFHKLMRFFSRLSRLNRLVTLKNVQLRPLQTNQNQTYLSANCVMFLYRTLTDAELKATKN
ncbi:MAG: type 4a pilus biogenesis protein PilO [Desulfohalobiaceae bacterium]|nr:type 4a pilus biogenesis protein PilO [Desulfohalobiaceae bacterium]